MAEQGTGALHLPLLQQLWRSPSFTHALLYGCHACTAGHRPEFWRCGVLAACISCPPTATHVGGQLI